MYVRVVDIETTHEKPEEGGVCEIATCDVEAIDFDLLGAPTRWQVSEGGSFSMLCDPGLPIPPITSAIHHIIDEDVKGKPDWRGMLNLALNPSGGEMPVALVAHSAGFERLWAKGMSITPWICTYKTALRMWPDAPSHSNMALRYWRKPEGLVRALALPAHRAGPDAYVTAFHIRDLLNEGIWREGEAHVDLSAMMRWTNEPALQITCHIGDWRGKKWREVDEGFMEWILRKGTFDEDVIFTCKTELARRAKEWQEQQQRHDEDAEQERRELAGYPFTRSNPMGERE